jgi:hypothetical protein
MFRRDAWICVFGYALELMAKRRGRPPGLGNNTRGVPETIGAAIGSVAAKLDTWMAQRQEIANDLNAVISRAKSMLSSLEVPLPRRKPGRPPALAAPVTRRGSVPGTRKRRKMSAAARKRISDAQKARWAKQKAAKKANS